MFVNKILSKCIHVRSCFKKCIARNTMVQSKFNFDTWFSRYDFLFTSKKNNGHTLMSAILDYPACHTQPNKESTRCQRKNCYAFEPARALVRRAARARKLFWRPARAFHPNARTLARPGTCCPCGLVQHGLCPFVWERTQRKDNHTYTCFS
jgi:hypothetical protein